MKDRLWQVGMSAVSAALLAGPLPAAGGVADVAAEAITPEAEDLDGPQYIRVVEERGKSVALEIAVRDFVPAKDAAGPVVRLVGVVHIADASYYEQLQRLLDDEPLVLYESVKPAGTGGAGGETDPERIASTRAAIQFAAALIEQHHVDHEQYPEDLDALRAFVRAVDPRHGKLLDVALVDAWGRALEYERTEPGFALLSLGGDGKPGGSGVDADIHAAADVHPLASNEDNIQIQLADALALDFQLEALDYDREHWRCSDMAIDEVQRAMEARGSDFSLIEGTLAGTSLTAQFGKVLLTVLKFADAFLDGAVSDAMKVVLMEMLGDETMIEMSLSQFDEGFAEVIIADRNQVVIDDLKSILETGEEVDSIAILYGAGHMPDLARKLGDQLAYRAGDASWLRAIEVDLTKTAVPESDIRRLRLMVRRMMRQMSLMNKRRGLEHSHSKRSV